MYQTDRYTRLYYTERNYESLSDGFKVLNKCLDRKLTLLECKYENGFQRISSKKFLYNYKNVRCES